MSMTTLREAAQQALEAWDTRAGIDTASRAFEAIRAALAEPVQEPVAWWHRKSDTFTSGSLVANFKEWTPLYPAPPQRKPLTEEEILKQEPHRAHWEAAYDAGACARAALDRAGGAA